MTIREAKALLVSYSFPLDKVVLAFIILFLGIVLFDTEQVPESIRFLLASLGFIFPFLVLSVVIAGGAKATGLDQQIATVFAGHARKMIIAAAIFGGLSPFCSCTVIPLIAGLLQAGVPLAPVMAFWISSPLMDPEMFILLSAVLGIEFTIVKTIAAIVLGLGAGFTTHALVQRGLFTNPLREEAVTGYSGCSPSTRSNKKIVWAFWKDDERRNSFIAESKTTGWFLFKWLTLAFLIESLMVAYIPPEFVGNYLGANSEWWLIPTAAAVGVPAYLNGYAAIPMVGGLVDMGMSLPGALTFMVAGGVSSLPASMAVFVLVRRNLFVWYLILGFVGSILSGFGYLIYLQFVG